MKPAPRPLKDEIKFSDCQGRGGRKHSLYRCMKPRQQKGSDSPKISSSQCHIMTSAQEAALPVLHPTHLGLRTTL
ncbi:uncharacterized protein ACIGJ3_007763 isoform 2-T4 [Trichechus inunguis]